LPKATEAGARAADPQNSLVKHPGPADSRIIPARSTLINCHSEWQKYRLPEQNAFFLHLQF
jgi:hypothetical protein